MSCQFGISRCFACVFPNIPYKWINTLAETANGGLSGKEKIMLETYIQMNYFDRIIARANTRLMIMTDGQYDLIRHLKAI